MSLTSDRAYSILCRTVYTRMGNDLVLVMTDGCLGDRADVFRASLQHVGVIGRKHRCRSTNDRAEAIVKLLGLGLFHGRLEGRAGGGFGAANAWDAWVLVEIMVVISCCANYGTLFPSACGLV